MAVMMKAANTSETSVQITRRNIAEDSHLQDHNGLGF
jgi:hypothetical protein